MTATTANAGSALLIVPPGGQVAYPSLAPASLKAYAACAGIDVHVRDLNLDAFLAVTSRAFVDRAFARLERDEAAIAQRVAGHPDAVDLLRRLTGLDRHGISCLYDIPDRLRDAETFLDVTAYARAMGELTTLTNLVELLWWPIRFTPGSLLGGMFGRVRHWSELLDVETPYDEPLAAALDGLDLGQDVIGLSAFSMDQVVYALRMVPALRARAPGALVVLGGNALGESELPESFERLLAKAFDLVIIGDGEGPLVAAVEHARGTRARADVPNALHCSAGELVRNEAHYKFRYEQRCVPDFGDLPLDRYVLPSLVLPFRFSNGCGYGRCTFCAESADRGPLTPRLVYREIPTSDVGEQLAALQQRHGASIFVNCSSLVSAEGAAAMGDAIVAAGLDVQWFAMVRAERGWLEDDALERAVAGGASALNFGIESLHPRLNRLMRKGIDLDRAEQVMRRARELGVDVTMYTVANYPTETLQEYEEHLERAWRGLGDTWDIMFQSLFMMVVEAPAFGQHVKLRLDRRRDEQRLEELRGGEFPIYLLAGGEGSAYRWDGDRLADKLDRYHRQMLQHALERPLYFDRGHEITSTDLYWEPEYNMIRRRLEREGRSQRRPPSRSLRELARSEVRLERGVTVERLGNGVHVVARPDAAQFVYVPGHVGVVLNTVAGGGTLAEGFREVIALGASPRQVLEAYEAVHRQLRHLGLVTATSTERAPAQAIPARLEEVTR